MLKISIIFLRYPLELNLSRFHFTYTLYFSGVTNASEYRVQLLNFPQNAFRKILGSYIHVKKLKILVLGHTIRPKKANETKKSEYTTTIGQIRGITDA